MKILNVKLKSKCYKLIKNKTRYMHKKLKLTVRKLKIWSKYLKLKEKTEIKKGGSGLELGREIQI